MSQYFEENNKLIDEKKLITIKFKDKYYKVYTNNGVFSKDKLDYGTKLLLENITENNLEGDILDLGCGYGIIGIVLASTYPNTQIDMCDITDRAVNLSKENTKNLNLNNTNIIKSDIYENIDKKYNYIITNPPIRAGKDILRKFLFGAKDYLEDNGELWFVMRKDHGVKSMIKELENIYKIEIKEKSKGFYIVICRFK